jgi:uncharacterized protein YqjF (DUF2071 family)
MNPRVFLTAEWRYLAMLNYEVDRALLAPYVPVGTELDDRDGRVFVSVVGFLFRDTRVLGLPIPWHRDFEELNLRFYVRRSVLGEQRHGVTFIRELVPRPAIATVARLTYNEPYRTAPMRHRIGMTHSPDNTPDVVEYSWLMGDQWSRLSVAPIAPARPMRAGSEEEYITDRPWGYTRQRDGSTIEYRVEHSRWNVWPVRDAVLEGDLTSLYGSTFAQALRGNPTSAFVADGSPVTVFAPQRLR